MKHVTREQWDKLAFLVEERVAEVRTAIASNLYASPGRNYNDGKMAGMSIVLTIMAEVKREIEAE